MPGLTISLDARLPSNDLPLRTETDGLGLGAHFRACERALGRMFALRCLAERVHEWAGPRLCTVVFGAAALMVLASGLD